MPTCALCNKTFPNYTKIEGKMHNISCRKYCIECSPWGKHNTRRLHINKNFPEYKICSKCGCNKHNSEFYRKLKTQLGAYCKKCFDEYTVARKYQKKAELIKYKGGKCCICGYNKSQEAIDFHHVDPTTKEFNVSNKNRSLGKLKLEADKCILVCRNCHHEIHFGLHKQYKITVINKTAADTKEIKLCPHCNVTKSVNAFYPKRDGSGYASWCRECNKEDAERRYHSIKKERLKYRGSKCSSCGYDKCIASLDFHHTDPTKKEFSIEDCDKNDLEAVMPELDKCVILCKNCHAEIHTTYPN